MKHQNGARCLRCEEKLKEANPEIVSFFYWLKPRYQKIHISWTFRDQANQDQFFMRGTSKLKWPNSPHNATDLMGKADSHAIDLFVLDDDKALWPIETFKAIAKDVRDNKIPMIWGGDFIHLGDFDHFQMV